eukprot:2469440-Rhodomonas_salina.1
MEACARRKRALGCAASKPSASSHALRASSRAARASSHGASSPLKSHARSLQAPHTRRLKRARGGAHPLVFSRLAARFR